MVEEHERMDTSDEEVQNPLTIAQKNNCISVSTLNKCQSKFAAKLLIYNGARKLTQGGEYDIGGTYADTIPEFWFYFTASSCHGDNHLLNLFVCHRRIGYFNIGISNSNEFIHKEMQDIGESILPSTLTWSTFQTVKENKTHYIKTYCFSKTDLSKIGDKTLVIPITVNTDARFNLNNDVVRMIKLEHDLGSLLSKQEKTDIILESVSKKVFHAHKIVLAAHSPVLRSLVKNISTNTLFIDISDIDMELLLQFIYTGTIQDVMKQDCMKLLEIAERFQLKPLFLLTQHVISNQINVNNAIELAILAKKYKLENLLYKVYRFVKDNPDVMKTDGWKMLDDVELAKCLFLYLQTSRDHDYLGSNKKTCL